MFCSTGKHHSITLSEDDLVYSFGDNTYGQLGFSDSGNLPIPTLIPDLQNIKTISCGENFTVCVDYEGYVWSFGCNLYGQLGTNKTHKGPQKIDNIPPVKSISCGSSHTLILTEDENLWSCGNNGHGQLCIENRNNKSIPYQTAFSNVTQISAGHHYSLFLQNTQIYGCGSNEDGQLGLGHKKSTQIKVCPIVNQPPQIMEFCAGKIHSLFLDIEGNVYSVGCNYYGSLGLGDNVNKCTLQKLSNIPPIRYISSIDSCSFFLDFDGNVWSCGSNKEGMLGHGDNMEYNTPTKINSISDIIQISYGSSSYHFLAKDSQHRIFVMGNNNHGQLGRNHTTIPNSESQKVTQLKPKILNTETSIWRNSQKTKAKSARK